MGSPLMTRDGYRAFHTDSTDAGSRLEKHVHALDTKRGRRPSSQ